MIDRGRHFSLDTTAQRLSESDQRSIATVPDVAHTVNSLVGPELKQAESLIKSSVTSVHSDVDRLSGHAAAMGGKRLRPMLVLICAQAGGQATAGRRRIDLLRIAAAVELVHAASLVHDDVMDEASHRRHLPTVAKLEGGSAAILLGDYLFTKAYDLAAHCQSSFPARKIAQASTDLCEGELRQQMAIGQWSLPLREYRSILSQKTGALCSVSCRLGAWAGGGNRTVQSALQRFGRNLGLAFQLFDDWLDYWGTQATGKTLGTDLRQGKPTLPVLRLLEQASATEQPRLLQLLESSDLQPAEKFSLVRGELERCDASQFTLKTAQNCVKNAIMALDAVPDSDSRRCLAAIARFSIARQA